MKTAPARRQLRPTDVKRLNRSWRRRTHNRLGLILESVTGPFNVGSVFRTAAAFGVAAIRLAGNATPPTHPKAQKTALGTDRLVEWHAP
ncbi:MAG: TrmH family RNA methyltransferase, partial [Thermobispora bispora]|nr:TrmH family RNA methyltransferase [Thermobispora bispora]